jgi:hypothetical protein
VIARPLANDALSSRVTASRTAAGLRGRRVSSQDCSGAGTRNCRSANSRVSSSARNVSGAAPIFTAVVARNRLARSGSRTGSRPGAVRDTNNTGCPVSAAAFRRCSSAGSFGTASTESTATGPRGQPSSGASLNTLPPRRSAQACARCVLPVPLSPQSASRRNGHGAAPSSHASASAWPGLGNRSSAPYPALRGNRRTSCAGKAVNAAAADRGTTG